MRALTGVLLGLLIGLAAGFFGGKYQGALATSAARDATVVQDLTHLIDSHKSLVGAANAASKAMRTALSVRAASDAKSTQELRDALAADPRPDCDLDAGVMRQLADARERAAQAAAGGIRGALPAADAALGLQP